MISLNEGVEKSKLLSIVGGIVNDAYILENRLAASQHIEYRISTWLKNSNPENVIQYVTLTTCGHTKTFIWMLIAEWK